MKRFAVKDQAGQNKYVQYALTAALDYQPRQYVV